MIAGCVFLIKDSNTLLTVLLFHILL